MRVISVILLIFLGLEEAQGVTELVVKADLLACRPERQFNRAERLRKSGDEGSLAAFTTGALLARTCIRLTAGTKVFAAGRGKGPGVIRVRPKGSFVTFFAAEENFEQVDQ
jgi:hypothetical protein